MPPGLALVLTVFLLAQAGIPLTGGFLAKFYVVGAVVDQGQYALAVIAMVSAVIAAYLYLKIIISMYFAAPEGAAEVQADVDEFAGPPVRIPAAAAVALAIALVGTVALGIVPGPATGLTNDATAELTSGG